MKALLISAIVFFSLRAMSAEVGETEKSPCPYANQSASRDAKVVADDSGKEVKAPVVNTINH